MAYDERGLQSLGIVTQKTDRNTKVKTVTKPMFIYTSDDAMTAITTAGYFKSTETPCLLSNTALDGSLIIIKAKTKTSIKRLSVTEAGVVSVVAVDKPATVTTDSTKVFDPELLNMVGANTINVDGRANVLWLYSSNEQHTEILGKGFFSAKSTDPMKKMAEFDKIRQINQGDVLVMTYVESNVTKVAIKVFVKTNAGVITLEDLNAPTASAPTAGEIWDVRKMQMLGSSVATLKSNVKSIRVKTNLIKTGTLFLLHDELEVAKMAHANYWKYTKSVAGKPTNDQDISKLSYAKANMKTGDIIILKGSDHTAMMKISVDGTTNAITLTTIDA